MQLGTRRLISIYVTRIFVGAALCAAFGAVVGASIVEPPLLGAALGVLSGSLDGAALMVFGEVVTTFLPRTRLGRALYRAPLAFAFAVRSFLYTGIILCVIGGKFGPRMTALIVGGDVGHALLAQMDVKVPTVVLIAAALMVTMFFVFLHMLIQLVGEETFRDLALGRYRRARHEERFFLFVDIAGSTPLAERVGPASMHRFLSKVFAISSDSIDDHGGSIFQYVGDEMVITWTISDGRPDARPLACFFSMEKALTSSSEDFKREFGSVPHLRAALHAGEVITGEVGGSRRAIVFHGDVMNTASRLEHATRALQRAFLASEEALSRIDGKECYRCVDLGLQQLRGRIAPVHVYAVELETNT